MHHATVKKGQWCIMHKKREKLYPITLGFARKGIARTCKTIVQDKPYETILTLPDPPYDIDLVPIYMSCTECGLYLGSDEEDYADMLGGMCFICFRKLIGQTDVWYDKLPTRLYNPSNKKWNSDQIKIKQAGNTTTLNVMDESVEIDNETR